MSWQHIRGHESTHRRFAVAIRHGRLGHAYLFVGPEGVGKKAFAIEMAKALLCEAESAFDACDRCAACLLVDANTHPDLVIAGRPPDKHEFPVKLMQELAQGLSLKPARGRRRITILNDANDFNEESANCFLKTLEEPPPKSLLILIGTDAAFQLPTIRSRCQTIPFCRLPDATVMERLQQLENVERTQIPAILRLAVGSPGRAAALVNPTLWTIRRQTLETMIQPKPDSVSLAKSWTAYIEAAGKETALQRQRALLLLQLAIDLLHLALATSLNQEPRIDDKTEADMFRQLVARLGTDALLQRIDRLIAAEAHVDRRVQLILAVEAAIDAVTQDIAPAFENSRAFA